MNPFLTYSEHLVVMALLFLGTVILAYLNRNWYPLALYIFTLCGGLWAMKLLELSPAELEEFPKDVIEMLPNNMFSFSKLFLLGACILTFFADGYYQEDKRARNLVSLLLMIVCLGGGIYLMHIQSLNADWLLLLTGLAVISAFFATRNIFFDEGSDPSTEAVITDHIAGLPEDQRELLYEMTQKKKAGEFDELEYSFYTACVMEDAGLKGESARGFLHVYNQLNQKETLSEDEQQMLRRCEKGKDVTGENEKPTISESSSSTKYGVIFAGLCFITLVGIAVVFKESYRIKNYQPLAVYNQNEDLNIFNEWMDQHDWVDSYLTEDETLILPDNTKMMFTFNGWSLVVENISQDSAFYHVKKDTRLIAQSEGGNYIIRYVVTQHPIIFEYKDATGLTKRIDFQDVGAVVAKGKWDAFLLEEEMLY